MICFDVLFVYIMGYKIPYNSVSFQHC